MKIICLKPSTFFSTDTKVTVLDNKNKLFYFHPNKQGKINFNLPTGEYYTRNNIIRKVFKPYVTFRKSNLKFDPSDFRIVIKENQHKATINPTYKTITIDPEMARHYYKPCISFLIAHEIAHLEVGGSLFDNRGNMTFDAEKMCDAIAENYLLSHGFNPSQIKVCRKLLLSNPERKNFCHYDTKKFNFRK